MTLGLVLGIGAIGGLGALARFILDGGISSRLALGFPIGTLVVNLSGSFALGALVGGAVDGDAFKLGGTGLIGSFTTFSTWALESHRLGEEGELGLGILNFMLSLVLGVAAAWAGRRLGVAL
jgi:CrcB protein